MNIQYLGQISTNLQVLFSSPKESESTQEETKPRASPMDPWLLIQKLSFKGKPLGTTLRERQQASQKCGCSCSVCLLKTSQNLMTQQIIYAKPKVTVNAGASVPHLHNSSGSGFSLF